MEPTAPQQQTPPTQAQSDERMWAMLCHLSSLVALVGVPLGHILGPLIIWLIKKNEMPSIEAHGKEAINFQISMTIYMAVAAFLIMVLIGVVLLPALIVMDIVCVILAALKANNGELYRYPLTIRFLK